MVPQCKIRLGVSEATLAYLVYGMGLPEPDLPVYADHASKVNLGDGGQSLRGSASASLTWRQLTGHQAWQLRLLIENALATAGAELFMTIDKGWGNLGPPYAYIDVRGKPRIVDAPPISQSRATMRNNVTVFINNLTVVNDPASF